MIKDKYQAEDLWEFGVRQSIKSKSPQASSLKNKNKSLNNRVMRSNTTQLQKDIWLMENFYKIKTTNNPKVPQKHRHHLPQKQTNLSLLHLLATKNREPSLQSIAMRDSCILT